MTRVALKSVKLFKTRKSIQVNGIEEKKMGKEHGYFQTEKKEKQTS
jgi:hypothetical protein